jgi:hypothetical protein
MRHHHLGGATDGLEFDTDLGRGGMARGHAHLRGRSPIEWLAQMADALLAQSAIDRLQSAYELVLDGESYRRRQKPGLDTGTITARPRRRRRPA